MRKHMSLRVLRRQILYTSIDKKGADTANKRFGICACYVREQRIKRPCLHRHLMSDVNSEYRKCDR